MNASVLLQTAPSNKCLPPHLITANSTANSSNKPCRTCIPDTLHVSFQVVYSLIAALSIFLNAVVCVVLARKRTMLNKPHNILILNLALTDAMTGLLICFTPGMTIQWRGQLPLDEGPGAELFCPLIQSRFFLYTFGKASLLTVLCLAVERWVSMVKPIFFRTSFSKKRVFAYLVLIWITSVVCHLKNIFDFHAVGAKCRFSPNKFMKFSRSGYKWFTIGYVTITFFLPLTVTWLTFAHIWHVLKKSPAVEARSVLKAIRRVLRMCAMTALLLSVCWLPAEISMVTHRFLDICPWEFAVHGVLVALSMFNSCTNPSVYYVTNMEYRREIKRLFCCKLKNIPTSAISTELPRVGCDTKL